MKKVLKSLFICLACIVVFGLTLFIVGRVYSLSELDTPYQVETVVELDSFLNS